MMVEIIKEFTKKKKMKMLQVIKYFYGQGE